MFPSKTFLTQKKMHQIFVFKIYSKFYFFLEILKKANASNLFFKQYTQIIME